MLVLVAGTGSIGQRHINNLIGLVNDPTFVFVRSGAREDEYSFKMGAKVVSTIEEGIALKPELALVATPSSMHFSALQALLSQSIPCYIEKPVVTKMEHCEQLHRLLNSITPAPITLVGCNLRYLPSLIKLRQLLLDKVIGQVIRVNMQVGQWLPDWRPNQDYRTSYSANTDQGGGVILDLIHEVDMARWLFGDFSQVYAIGGQYSQLDINAEDCAAILLGRTNGPVVSIGMDYISRQRIRRYEIVGDQGTLVWDLGSKTLQKTTADNIEIIDAGSDSFDMSSTYITAMSVFLNAISTNTSVEQDLLEGLRSLTLALNIKRQLNNENNR